MILDKEKQIRNSLNNKEYRDALAIEHVNTTIAIQIRKLRERQPWSQSDLANRLGKHQETISQWENPDYGRHSITSLKALASIFDVALLVKFIPFSELIEDMVNLSDNRLSPRSYKEEAIKHIKEHGCFPVTFEMPCKNEFKFETSEEIMDLPIKDVPCPCGDKSHWLIKFEHY